MDDVTPRGVSMVCRLFMVSSLMMLGGFRMVMRGMRKMIRCLLVVLSSLLRHVIPPWQVKTSILARIARSIV
jgi:hypothetical protein